MMMQENIIQLKYFVSLNKVDWAVHPQAPNSCFQHFCGYTVLRMSLMSNSCKSKLLLLRNVFLLNECFYFDLILLQCHVLSGKV